jgi:hypothetical protein
VVQIILLDNFLVILFVANRAENLRFKKVKFNRDVFIFRYCVFALVPAKVFLLKLADKNFYLFAQKV